MATKKTVTPKPATKKPRVTKETVVSPRVTSQKTSPKKETNLIVPVLSPDGKESGTMTLPKEVFGLTPNKQLIAQAVRIYLANQRQGNASTKTRGEVEGSTRKIYRQKGTGRARHGGIRAPIFVGGGISFGPKPRDYHLNFPQKMKQVALFSALSSQLKKGNIVVIDGFESLDRKTKAYADAFLRCSLTKRMLFVVPKSDSPMMTATRNIGYVTVMPANLLNAYSVLHFAHIVFAKDAIPALVPQTKE